MGTDDMKVESGWKDNSNGDFLKYDFSPPQHWTRKRAIAEQAAIVSSLDRGDFDTGTKVSGWLQLARRLPDALRAALIAELRAGNQLASIESMGWPSEGSIIVSMHERFSVGRHTLPIGVTWRKLNDPHYWREELSQKIGQVDFLIIT
jgi:hypothetical protein